MVPKYPSQHSLSGQVLAASPKLLDPHFRESLVYLAEHDAEGSFGLILNRPTGKTLGEMVSVDMPDAVAKLPLYLGGPVSPKNVLVAVFEKGPGQTSFECRITSANEELAAVVSQENTWVRAFAGYSGWGQGQLDGELKEDSWRICPPTAALFDEQNLGGIWKVYAHESDRWERLLPFVPDDPSRN